jgi:DNA-binding beta-propeller fold protein YncE
VLAAGAAWVTSGSGDAVVRIDAATGEVTGSVQVGVVPVGIVEHDGLLWVANSGDGTVARIDPSSGNFVGDSLRVGNAPMELGSGDAGLWVVDYEADRAYRIDG